MAKRTNSERLRAASFLKSSGIIIQHGLHELAIAKPAALLELTKP